MGLIANCWLWFFCTLYKCIYWLECTILWFLVADILILISENKFAPLYFQILFFNVIIIEVNIAQTVVSLFKPEMILKMALVVLWGNLTRVRCTIVNSRDIYIATRIDGNLSWNDRWTALNRNRRRLYHCRHSWLSSPSKTTNKNEGRRIRI